ncbi:MAG: phosphatase PAP2 family protein [Saprospiraceae bacterium]|nr:phosphatase PAP2 family protein [Lewinella sp.]
MQHLKPIFFRLDRTWFFLLITLLVAVSCRSTPEKEAVTQSIDKLDHEILLDLNHFTYTIANEHDQFYSFIGVRALTMVHLAIHDAVNSIDPHYETYVFETEQPRANPIAATVAAARTILSAAYPARLDTIQSVCDRWLQTIADTTGLAEGTMLGNSVARTIIELREGDGHEKQGDYTPMNKPGAYQYTPGFNNWVLYPDFDYARPFTLDSVTQFRSPPPPALDSEVYTASLLEVQEYGRKGSTVRSEDQTNFAHWWAEFAEHSWNRIGRIVAEQRSLSFAETARMFALINMNIYDTYIASLEAKYHYDTWRPYTAIRTGSVAINPATTAEPDWEPEMLTPPWPEYPSAHAAVGAGGAEIVTAILGSPDVNIRMESITALSTAKERTITDLDQAADQCAESRIMNGYHFRFATDEGKRQGRALARHILDNYLLPVGS